MSLYHSWQQSRQQRNQTVRAFLATAQQQRQITATQLRDDLTLFREILAQQDQMRRENAQQLQQQLQQFKTALQTDIQTFLTSTASQRRAEAQQLAQDLAAFRQSLQAEVADLRQDLQLELAVNQEGVNQFLSQCHAQRKTLHLQTTQALAEFVDNLRLEVQTYLTATQSARQEMATQLRQTLAQSWAKRTAEMQTLFDQLGQFRGELGQFRSNLRQQVWGTAVPLVARPTQVVAKPKMTKPPTLAVPKPVSSKPEKASLPTSSRSLAAAIPTKPTGISTPVGGSPHGGTIAVAPAPTPTPLSYEKAVYNHIHKTSGARLTEIEAALEINRIQAVDALRSLIKKGLITQRDRIYLVQEPILS